MNQEALAYLRKLISFAQYDWADLLPSAQLGINSRDSLAPGMSPSFIEHGYHVSPIFFTPI